MQGSCTWSTLAHCPTIPCQNSSSKLSFRACFIHSPASTSHQLIKMSCSSQAGVLQQHSCIPHQLLGCFSFPGLWGMLVLRKHLEEVNLSLP